MTRKRRWFWIIPAFLAVMALSWGGGRCRRQAQGGRGDQTGREGRQANRPGSGRAGVQEMFTGVGHTVVEGAKFSGENIKEFFAGKK
jgi:hypothetical protein